MIYVNCGSLDFKVLYLYGKTRFGVKSYGKHIDIEVKTQKDAEISCTNTSKNFISAVANI